MPKPLNTLTLLLALFFAGSYSQAQFSQPGELDTSFNFGQPNGYIVNDPNLGTGANNGVWTTAIQPDGKILIGGNFTNYNGTSRNRIARLNADGSLDTTFNPGTGANGTVQTTTLQPDGKILIGGIFQSYNGFSRNRIARLNADGSLDATFNPVSGANDDVNALALQSDGKMLIGGFFTSYNSVSRNRIARLNADGSLDATFNPGTGASGSVLSFTLQPDGKVIIGGEFLTYNGTARNRIARLNADGTLDATFNSGTGADGSVRSLARQPDGKILVGGGFITYNGTGRNHIARLNADGSLDATFNPGTGANSSVQTTTLQPDGKILIGGEFSTYNGTSRNRIARLNVDGSLDATFDPGTGANSTVLTTAPQPDGKILIGGAFLIYNGTSRNRIARLNANGTLDATFNPITGADQQVLTTTLQPNGKILIGGWFTNYNGTSRNRIARLNADGSLDETFNPGSGSNNDVEAITLQPDGKILIGGAFTTFNGTSRNCIARLNIDGTLDATFNPGTGASSRVESVALQPDGKILIGGSFTTYNGTSRHRIARLNADGTIDTTFNPGTGADGSVISMTLQPDGKIIIGGNFITFNGTTRSRIARLNINGTLDATFNPGTGPDQLVSTTKLQPDGKILIGGLFTNYNGTSMNRIVRLNADGTVDITFMAGTGANLYVRTITLQPDGKIIIAGQFSFYNGTPRNLIARLNADGTLDATFNPGLGANAIVNSTTLQPDGKIIIGGEFTTFNGIIRNKIARIFSPICPTISNTTSTAAICQGQTKLLSGTPAGTWSIVSGAGSISDSVFSANGAAGLVTVVNNVGGCLSPTVTFTVNPLPSVSNAGPNQNLCVDTATLNGNNPSVGVGAWSSLGTAIVTTPSSRLSGVSNLVAGNNLFVWTVTSGVCAPSRDTVVITRAVSPTVSNARNDTTVCSTTVTLNGNTATIGTGLWTSLDGAALTTATSPNSGVTGLVVGINRFVWTISNGVCSPSRDTVNIIREAAPTTSAAGVDQTVCATAATLSGNVPSTGTGLWTSIGSALVTTPGSNTSGVTGLAVGNNLFVWTISNGSCTPSRDTVNIIREAAPTTSAAGVDQTVCATAVTLSGNVPSTGTGLWTSIGSALVTTPGSNTSGVTGLAVGNNLFVWTISNGSCTPSRDTVNIIREAAPTTSNAGVDQTLCLATASLSGNVPSTGAGLWTSIGSALVTTPGSNTSGVTGLAVGNNLFVWTVSNGSCTPSRDTVNIIREDAPTTSAAGVDQTVCATAATLSGNVPSTGTGLWTSIGSALVTTPLSNTSGVTGLVAGNNLFVWTISNGICNPSRDTVNIQRDASPTPSFAGPDQTDTFATATLNGNAPGVGTGIWSSLGSAIVTNPSNRQSGVTNLMLGNNLFVWTISNGVCIPSRDTVNIIRNSLTHFIDKTKSEWLGKVFPVPFHSELRIQATESFLYELLDLRGLTIMSGATATTEAHLFTDHLASGIYFVKIMGKNGAVIRKVMKE
jgi:uncharacterized delta-60 repeat protein